MLQLVSSLGYIIVIIAMIISGLVCVRRFVAGGRGVHFTINQDAGLANLS